MSASHGTDNANRGSRRVMLVAPPVATAHPVSALAERGWDVYAVSDVRRPRMVEAAIEVARSSRRQPLATWRVARSPSRRQRFMRARTISVRPGLLHVFSRDRARDWSIIAGALGAGMIATLSADEAIAMSCDEHAERTPISAFHVESEDAAQHLAQEGGTPVVVIPPVPDPALVREPNPADSHSGQLRIISVGPLSWTQGYEHALYAIKLLAERGVPVQYRIVGVGEYLDAVVFARHQLGLKGLVELVEPCSGAELRVEFRWANALVDAAVAATSPKPVLDAHAAGLPVITTHPRHAAAALVVHRRDPGELCDALATLAGDTELRARLVDAGRRRALEVPGESIQAARFGELYSAALDGRDSSIA